MDQKHLVDTALRQYDLAKGALNGGALFEAILQKASARDIQAILGDKQGGRASLLLGAKDQHAEYLEKLNHGEGFAQKITTFAGESRAGQLAIAGRVMVDHRSTARWFPASCSGHAGQPIRCFARAGSLR